MKGVRVSGLDGKRLTDEMVKKLIVAKTVGVPHTARYTGRGFGTWAYEVLLCHCFLKLEVMSWGSSKSREMNTVVTVYHKANDI